MEVDIKNHKTFNLDFTEQLGVTDEPLDAVTRSIAESDAGVAKVMKIRQDEPSKIAPTHNQVAETTTRLELFKETVDDKEVTSSEPS